MDDIGPPAFASLFSGFRLNRSISVIGIRLLTFLALMILFGAVWVVHTSIQRLFFSVVIGGVVLVIKLSLYIVNVVIDKAAECERAVEEEPEPTPQRGFPRPASIPSILWQMRHQYPDGISDDDVVRLLLNGFEPDAVFDLVLLIRRHSPEIFERADVERVGRKVDPTDVFINCCGKSLKLPFGRQQVNELFPGNLDLLYVIIATLLACLTAFMLSYVMQDMSVGGFIWMCMVAGAATYSLLHPPETDMYLLTRGDVFAGTTRCYALFMISACWKVSEMLMINYKQMDVVSLELKVDWTSVFEYIDFLCKWGLYIFPVWMLCAIGHPLHMIVWTVEWIDRYLFGLGGCGGLWHALLQFLRSAGVTFVMLIGLEVVSHFALRAIVVSLAFFALQVPLGFQRQKRSAYERVCLFALCLTVLAFALAIPGHFMGFKVASYLTASVTVVVDLAVPYLMSENRYYLWYLRVLPCHPLVGYVRLAVPACLTPMLMCALLADDPAIPNWLAAVLCVIVMNRALCESHVFALGMIFATFSAGFDVVFSTPTSAMFWSMLAARKVFSALPVIDVYIRSRSNFPLVDAPTGVIEMVLLVFWDITPSIDRVLSGHALLFSLITGAPLNSPGLIPLFVFAAAPRPNVFWDMRKDHAIDFGASVASHLSDHPLEAPVYASAAQAMTVALGPILKSGRLGVVDSNDVFLFISDSLTCFVHIIAREVHEVKFQVRGLEYDSETICHRNELHNIQSFCSEYSDGRFWEPQVYSMSTNWDCRALDIPLRMYNVSKFQLWQAFVGLEEPDRQKLAMQCLVSVISKCENLDSILEDIEPSSENNSQVERNCIIFGVNGDQSLYSKIHTMWRLVDRTFASAHIDEGLGLHGMFHGQHPEDSGLSNAFWDKIFAPTVRLSTLVWALTAMGLGADDDTDDAIKAFFSDCENEYVSAVIVSDAFKTAFEAGVASLMTIVVKDGSTFMLFFRMGETAWHVISVKREFVRSFWCSEAVIQVFGGETGSERLSIQSHDMFLHNLIVQSCNLPIGYPALVSPVLTSFDMETICATP